MKHVFQYGALLKAPGGVTEDLFWDNAALNSLWIECRSMSEASSLTSQLAHK
jgi:hypothetical protein